MKYSKKTTLKNKVLGFADSVNIVGGFKAGYDLGKNFETDLLYGFSAKEKSKQRDLGKE